MKTPDHNSVLVIEDYPPARLQISRKIVYPLAIAAGFIGGAVTAAQVISNNENSTISSGVKPQTEPISEEIITDPERIARELNTLQKQMTNIQGNCHALINACLAKPEICFFQTRSDNERHSEHSVANPKQAANRTQCVLGISYPDHTISQHFLMPTFPGNDNRLGDITVDALIIARMNASYNQLTELTLDIAARGIHQSTECLLRRDKSNNRMDCTTVHTDRQGRQKKQKFSAADSPFAEAATSKARQINEEYIRNRPKLNSHNDIH